MCVSTQVKSNRVESLLSMMDFWAYGFVGLIQGIARIENSLPLDTDVDQDLKIRLSKQLHYIGLICVDCGLSNSQKKCERIHNQLNTKGDIVTAVGLRHSIADLMERIQDELESQSFLYLEPRQSAMFKNPFAGWEECISRFEQAKHNIEECSKCFALERYGAAVFHIMLVAEFGVVQMAKLIGASDPHKPGWSDLARIEKAQRKPWNDKSDMEKKYDPLIESFLPLALAVKDSWRHKITHVENQIVWNDTDFSEHVAEEIIKAIRGMMRKLAVDLPAKPPADVLAGDV